MVLTAHNESELLIKLIDLGVDRFLIKPIDKQRMIDSFYKVCLVISDKKLMEKYQSDIEDLLSKAEKKNRILETKLKQNAQEKNKVKEKLKITGDENNTIEKQKKENYFETLDNEDSDELNDLCVEMDFYITLMFKEESIDDIYLEKLSIALSKYSAVLNMYPIFQELSVVLTILVDSIKTKKINIQNNQASLSLLFESLHFSLENFRVNVWVEKSEDPTFFNASFKSDIELLISSIDGEEVNNEIEFF